MKLRNFDIDNSKKMTLMGGINVLESRENSEGELEAVVTRPELPNATNVEEIIFFLVFTIFGYVIINFLQKKSLEDNKE